MSWDACYAVARGVRLEAGLYDQRLSPRELGAEQPDRPWRSRLYHRTVRPQRSIVHRCSTQRALVPADRAAARTAPQGRHGSAAATEDARHSRNDDTPQNIWRGPSPRVAVLILSSACTHLLTSAPRSPSATAVLIIYLLASAKVTGEKEKKKKTAAAGWSAG